MYNILLAGLADDLCDVYISLTASSLVKPHKTTPLLAKNNLKKYTSRQRGVFSTFPACSQMSRLFYQSVIDSLGFFCNGV